jgi:hypothetical protein
MTTKRRQPAATIAALKHWAHDNARLASAVLAAQVIAEAKRAEVDAYTQAILDRYCFPPTPEWNARLELADRCRPDGGLARTRDLFLAAAVGADDDAQLAAFHAECDAAHRARGFDGPAGHCPALTAEHTLIEAQNALLDSGGALFGWESGQLYGATRAKALDLLIGACAQTGQLVNLFEAVR